MKQKHFIDIQNIREDSTELRSNNTSGFSVGDNITIQEKIDGSNACACYDSESGKMMAFSRKQELSFNNTLSGFWNFVQGFSDNVLDEFKAHPNWRVFGEWCSRRNKIVYTNINKDKPWYIYDIFDTETNKWLPVNEVEEFAKRCEFEFIHELYRGPFISWEHCKEFMNSPAYGERQEGIVVKKITDAEYDEHLPSYLKIVNEDFKETMKTHERVIDPEKEEAKAEAYKMMSSIVTKNRVEKEIYKMQDEGILNEKISPQDMKTVARTLPKRIYDDIIKEEKEIVEACGEFGGKMCASITMQLAREIIIGTNE
jgi:hypothetical protein